MSDFLLVRGINAVALQPLIDKWQASRKWVRSVSLREAWEPQQLEINSRDACAYMRPKHKADLAELVLLIQTHGGRVTHLMLHRSVAERIEEDVGEWARRHLEP
jgi:hypothetical protein